MTPIVIAIDNNPIRLRLARHNALHLGVADRIEFVLGDFVSYAESMSRRRGGKGEEVDVVFLSPPWGMPPPDPLVRPTDLLITGSNRWSRLSIFRRPSLIRILLIPPLGHPTDSREKAL